MTFRAVIAGDGRSCIVLWPQGECLEEMVRDYKGNADDIGFGMREGIHVWEGTMLGGQYDAYNGDYDGVWPDDSEKNFRVPSDAELQLLAAGKCPWIAFSNEEEAKYPPLPAWAVEGVAVDYHSVIGGPVTLANVRIRLQPWRHGGHGEWVVLIYGIAGCVSLDAITPAVASKVEST